MGQLIYRRGEQTVKIDEFRTGTRRILEQGGFELVDRIGERLDASPEWLALPDDVVVKLQEEFESPEAVKVAPDEEILAIHGIGPATLQKIREVLS